MARSVAKSQPKMVLTESEHDHQVMLFEWFIKEPLLAQWRTWSEAEGEWIFPAFAVPNARKISMGGMIYYKKEGLRPGFPDVVVPIPVGGIPGLVIEMKSPARRKQRDGGLQPNQKEWLEILRKLGWTVVCCWSFEEARQHVLVHLGLV